MRNFHKAKIVICILLCIFAILSVVGVVVYQTKSDSISGAFFRRMYGSIGVAGDNIHYLKLSLFCFKTDALFLDSVNNCWINGGADLVNIIVEEETQEADLTVYSVRLGISFPSEGQYDITELYYYDETGTHTYQLGKISFVYCQDTPIYMGLGMDTQIVNNTATYTFGDTFCENLQSEFTIKDLLLAKDENIQYEYETGCTCSPKEGLRYRISIDHSVSEYDLLVIQPIFQIESEFAEYNGVVVPIMLAYCGKDMTYVEIREYVK